MGADSSVWSPVRSGVTYDLVPTPPKPEEQLAESESLLQKIASHDDDMQQMLRDSHAESEKLRRLLKLVLLKAGEQLTMKEVLQSVGEGGLIVDPRPDISHESVMATAISTVAPKAGEGKWFEAQMQIRKLEQQQAEYLQEIEGYASREVHLRGVAAEADARLRAALEEISDKKQQLIRQDQELVSKAAAQLTLDLELQHTKGILGARARAVEEGKAALDAQVQRTVAREDELAQNTAAVARLDDERKFLAGVLSSVCAEHSRAAGSVSKLCAASTDPCANDVYKMVMAGIPKSHVAHSVAANPGHKGVSYMRSVSPSRVKGGRDSSVSPSDTDPQSQPVFRSPEKERAARGGGGGGSPTRPGSSVTFSPVVDVKSASPSAPTPPKVSPIVQARERDFLSPSSPAKPAAGAGRQQPPASPAPPVHAACVVLQKAPGGTMGLSWSTVGNVLTLRAVDQGSPSWEAGCLAFVGRKLISACGVPVRTAPSLSAITLPMSRVDLVFDSNLDDEA